MNSDIIKIFIGYDPQESIAWHTMASSIYRHSTRPVALIPLNLKNLMHIYRRQPDPKQSNEFSFTRFLVPYLCNYTGLAIYFDCDMLLRVDVAEILNIKFKQPNKAVYVVKHDYIPKNNIKFLNKIQYNYPRKNWSSVVLWNCEHKKNKIVNLEFINTASSLDLHRFTWLNDNEIGDLDVKWNWLVGEYEDPPSDVKNVHWTLGGPYFNEFKNADFSDEWREEFNNLKYCNQLKK